MAYAFCLRFDAESEATIAALWQVLVDCGAGDEMLRLGYPPHLSLAVLDEEPDRGVVEDALRGLDQLTGFVVQLRNVQHFPETPVVWLAAEGGQALSLLHRQLLDRLPEASVRAHYRAGQWTPHVTLQRGATLPRQCG